VIAVLDREVELVFVALGAAKFGAATGQHPWQSDGTPIRRVMGLIAASKIDFVLDIVKRLWARANPTRWKGIASNGHPAPICFGPRITAATYGCDAFQLAWPEHK
jgi:hypothetical protein